MKLNWTLIDKKLYNRDGSEVIPDKDGFVKIEVDGLEKKFLLTRLIENLTVGSGRRSIRVNRVKLKKGKENKHRCKKIIVTTPDNKELPFDSCADAARELNIKSRTNIPHALSGKYKHVEGYQFKYA